MNSASTHQGSARPAGQTSLAPRTWPWLLALARLTPVFLLGVILWMIWQRTPQVPVWDEWEMTELVQKLAAGRLTVSDLWAFHVHNEHRIVVSRLSSLVFIELTGWNRQVQMTFNAGVVAITVAFLLDCARSAAANRDLSAAMLLPFSLLLFSLARFSSWFQPVTDKIPTAFGVALCMWALARAPVSTPRFALALAGAVVASLSSLGGVLVWAAFAPAVWLTGRMRFLVWLAAALAIVVPYLVGFPTGTLTPDYTRETAQRLPPAEAVRYGLTLLGASVGYPWVNLALAFGLLSVALLGANVAALWWSPRREEVLSVRPSSRVIPPQEESRHRRRTVLGTPKWFLEALAPLGMTRLSHRAGAPIRRPIPQTAAAWGGLALFALGSAGAVAVGRGAGFGIESAIGSRFHTFSSLWWCVVFVVAAATSLRLVTTPAGAHGRQSVAIRALLAANVVVLALALAGVVQANVAGFLQTSAGQDRLRQNQGCVLAYAEADEACLALYHWDPALTRSRAAWLDARDLAIFGRKP